MTRATPTAAGSSIYDLGYRNYDGPRLGRRHAIRALLLHTLRVTYGIGRGGRAKLAPIILGGMATLPAVVVVGALALARQAGAGEVIDQSPVRHDTIYSLILTLVVLFCAAQAPETVGRDQRFRLLSLYFSRALRREDYALARFAGIVLSVLVFVLLPQLVMFLGLTLSAPDVGAALMDELAFVPGIVGQGLFVAGLLGGISMVVSAFTSRRIYATTAIIVILAVTPVVTQVLIAVGTTQLATLLVLLSPADVLEATNAWLFGGFPDSEAVIISDLPLEVFAAAAVAIIAICLVIVVRRYRGIAA